MQAAPAGINFAPIFNFGNNENPVATTVNPVVVPPTAETAVTGGGDQLPFDFTNLVIKKL